MSRLFPVFPWFFRLIFPRWVRARSIIKKGKCARGHQLPLVVGQLHLNDGQGAPSFLGVATQVMRLPSAGRRNSILLLAVTQLRSPRAGAAAAHRVGQGGQSAAVDLAVGG
mgnify:CR=1 FL=1